MTQVVQYQAEVFPTLPSRCAHLQTNVLETLNQNMQDLLKEVYCASQLLVSLPCFMGT